MTEKENHPNLALANALTRPTDAGLSVVVEWARDQNALKVMGRFLISRAATRNCLILAITLSNSTDNHSANRIHANSETGERQQLTPEEAWKILCQSPRQALRSLLNQLPDGLAPLIERSVDLTPNLLIRLLLWSQRLTAADKARMRYLSCACRGLELTSECLEFVAAVPTLFLKTARAPIFGTRGGAEIALAWSLIEARVKLEPVLQSLRSSTPKNASKWFADVLLRHIEAPDVELPLVSDDTCTALVTGKQLFDVRRRYGWCLSDAYVYEVIAVGNMVPILVRHQGVIGVAILHRMTGAHQPRAWLITHVYAVRNSVLSSLQRKTMSGLVCDRNPRQIFQRVNPSGAPVEALYNLVRNQPLEDDFSAAFEVPAYGINRFPRAVNLPA